MEPQILTPARYPAQLREIPQPPQKLWLQGALPEDGTRFLAVVGSRALTRYGREACEFLIAGLAGYPVSIISGLALGTDACAHKAALAAGLHTIAIPGSGLADDVLYPRAHVRLAREILAAGGALLSEHEPDYRAHPYDFPSRNRIMVGLAHAVLVIEAGERSGTLITGRLATDYNRELLCVPHRIGDANSFGAHLFLRQGAEPASEPSHVLRALGIEPPEEETAPPIPLSENEAQVIAALAEPRTRDELIRTVPLPAHETLALLGTLELKGAVKEMLGAWHRIR